MRPSLGYSTLYWSNLDRKKSELTLKEVFKIDDEPIGEPLNEKPSENKIQQSPTQSTAIMLPLKKPNQFGGNNGVEKT